MDSNHKLELTKEDITQFLQLIEITTFKGSAIDRVFELKQKLIAILKEKEVAQ